MSESKSITPPYYGTDFAKVDAHVIQPEEYDELPEWTEEMFATADVYEGGKLIRRGRPKAAVRKVAATIRYDSAVLEAFRASGKGWQTRMNDVLREYVRAHPSMQSGHK
jgi:uncharacterized protein (DUF4415 family)